MARHFKRATLFVDDAAAVEFPAGLQLIGSVVIDLPASGNAVQAQVELPQDYQLHLSSEAGPVTTFQSGPISIPALPPP